MGRPRKRRREGDVQSPEDLQSLALDPWGFGNGISEIGTALEHSTDDMNFADIIDPQHSSNGLPQTGPMGRNSTNLDTGSNIMDIHYQPQGPNDLGNADLSSGDLGFDLLSSSGPDNFSDFGSWISAPTQLRTPPSTADYNLPSQYPSQTDFASCSCLPELYKMLSSFPSSSNPSFPYSLVLLKQATNKGRDVLQCEVCPKAYNTALQNSMMLGTLIHLVISEYAKLLKHIDERSEKEDKIVFRMAEYYASERAHLHTGAVDCPMAISIDLCGAEWRALARKGVRKEIYGAEPGDHCLALILDGMRDRQIKWHGVLLDETRLHEHGMAPEVSSGKTANTCICTQVIHIDQLKRSLDALGL
ncbi:MAG: hypothetical protein Q9217_002465 [Psora testacea]